MRISYAAIDRLLEREAARDEETRQALQRSGKVTLSRGREMSDEALLDKLRTLNVPLDKDLFLAQSRDFLSAQEMSQAIIAQTEPPIAEGETDWVWIALTCFWERWQPERPSMEMIDDQMQEGYTLRENGDLPGACRVWVKTWKSVWRIMQARGHRSIDQFDNCFGGTESLFDWVQDLAMELGNASLDDPALCHEQIALLETLLGRIELCQNLRNSSRRYLAEAWFRIGMPDKGDALYRQWLGETPRWGGGWIGWSDCCYLSAEDAHKNPERAEDILKQGLGVPDVDDQEYLLDRLADLYDETGREREAARVRSELKQLRQPSPRVTAQASGNVARIKQTFDFGEQGLPVEQMGKFFGALRSGNPDPTAFSGKIGRNDPCPCGSGKKFKRCCGSNKT